MCRIYGEMPVDNRRPSGRPSPVLFKIYSSKISLNPDPKATTAVPEIQEELLQDEDRVFLQDIENSIIYAIKHEVPIKFEMDQVQIQALTSYLQVLIEHLPLSPNMEEFLLALHSRLRERFVQYVGFSS